MLLWRHRMGMNHPNVSLWVRVNWKVSPRDKVNPSVATNAISKGQAWTCWPHSSYSSSTYDVMTTYIYNHVSIFMIILFIQRLKAGYYSWQTFILRPKKKIFWINSQTSVTWRISMSTLTDALASSRYRYTSRLGCYCDVAMFIPGDGDLSTWTV